MTVLLLLVATLVRDYGREESVKGRHQPQLHTAFAHLEFRDDRIVEYTPYNTALNYAEAVEYCRDAGGAIAQPEDEGDLFYGLQCML